jgi:hypothetical protein
VASWDEAGTPGAMNLLTVFSLSHSFHMRDRVVFAGRAAAMVKGVTRIHLGPWPRRFVLPRSLRE